MILKTIAAAVLGACLIASSTFAQSVAEPVDYRLDQYRAPVPETLKGGTVVGPEAAYTLWMAGQTAFIDVLPQAPKPKNLPKGTIWRDKPRQSIPRATWLPNVGYGKIAEVTHTYFRQGLSEATKSDFDHPVLFFCLDECWMSWNAAKRALEYGYTRVYWFPEGTDGWTFQDYPTEEVKPKAGS